MRSMLLSVLCMIPVAGGCSVQETTTTEPMSWLTMDPRCKEQVARYQPTSGVVSSAQVAKSIASTYLSAAYQSSRQAEPLVSSLRNGVWFVHGTLPKGTAGGVGEVLLCQSNGRVLQLSHGK